MKYRVSQVCRFEDFIEADSPEEARKLFETEMDNCKFSDNILQKWEVEKVVSEEQEELNHIESLKEQEYREVADENN